MTIKEIESLSGMTRANIRFYEQEQLLCPSRAPNGYRDYSEDNLAALLRIKLLRSLNISLEEIRALQTGSSLLSDTLARQISQLEQVKQDTAYAQDICRIMQEDQVTYATLDPEKYLGGIPQLVSDRNLNISQDTMPQVFNPWRRYLARTLDIMIYAGIWWSILALCFHINLTTRSGILDFVDTVIALLLMLFLEPLLLRLFGTTPGKWIFGLTLEDENGRRPGYEAGFNRMWGVIAYGYGCYIPFYSLYRLWKSYKLCSGKEPQPWDNELVYSIRDTRKFRGVVFVGANVVLIFSLVLIIYSAQLPPNRGDLSVAEFAENYNTLARYYGIENGKQLDSEGKWADVEDMFYINISGIPLPEFEYTVEDGYLTGIRFDISIDNSDSLLTPSSDQMILSALAFTGAQDNVWLFSSVRNDMVNLIYECGFAGFSECFAGVRVTYDVEYSGYSSNGTTIKILIPEEGAATHFYMIFTMDKIND